MYSLVSYLEVLSKPNLRTKIEKVIACFCCVATQHSSSGVLITVAHQLSAQSYVWARWGLE